MEHGYVDSFANDDDGSAGRSSLGWERARSLRMMWGEPDAYIN